MGDSMSRRRWMLGVAGAGAAVLGLPGLAVAAPRGRWQDLTPAAALKRLEDGNARFVAGVSNADRSRTRMAQVEPKQAPFAAILGCADSRVPVELVFDQGFGDLFVTRVAGNVVTPEIAGSLEFGTLVLGAKVLYVLGHTRCGAVDATMKLVDARGQISALYSRIRPSVRASDGTLPSAIRQNVIDQMETLRTASPVLAELAAQGKLIITGGVYDLASGRVVPVPTA